MININPWDSRDALRWFMPRLKEDGELDNLLEVYLSHCLGLRILKRPSKGPYGEQGKDIVVAEDEEKGTYCSYLVKQGTLQKHLDGPYGILKQLEDAISIDLDLRLYKGKQRTAVVVHNDDEGYRGAIKRIEDKCEELEIMIGELLSRPISRWDIEEITNRFWKERNCIKLQSEIQNLYDRRDSALDLIVVFKTRYEEIQSDGGSQADKSVLSEFLYEMIKDRELHTGSMEGEK